jgi:hypothetical protein
MDLERQLARARTQAGDCRPGTQRDAVAHNLAVLRAGSSQPLDQVLLTPVITTPLPEPSARVWDEASVQADLADAVVFLLRARDRLQT